MSALMTGLVWELTETADFGRPEKIILLAYADHADANGKNIYPSIELIGKKAFYEERSVQTITRKLEKFGYLVADGVGTHGTNRWYIPLERLPDGGAKIAPLQKTEMRNFAPEEIAPEEIAPEPSVVVVKDIKTLIVVKAGENFRIYEQEFGALTPMIADAIQDAERTYPIEWISDAMRIAVKNNKRNWRYVEAILINCKAKNISPLLNKPDGKHSNNGADKKHVVNDKNKDIIRKVAQNATR